MHLVPFGGMGDHFDIRWHKRRAGMAGAATTLCVAGALLLGACGGAGETSPSTTAEAPPPAPETTDWPTYGLNPARTRFLPTDVVKPPFKIGWKYEPGKLMEYSPVVVGDRIYGIENNGRAFALDARGGKRIWRADIADQNASAPTYSDGRLYFSNLDPGQVVALSAGNGRTVWRNRLPGRTESSPLVVDGKVVAGCECNSVFAFDAQTGKPLWRTSVGGAVKGSPAFSDGIVYVGDYSGEITAINLNDGKVKWQTHVGGSVYATAAVAFGRVYAGTLSGGMYALDKHSGKVAWSASTGGYVYAAVAAAQTDDTPPSVYFGSYDGTVYALNAANGHQRWSQPVGGPISGAGSVVGDIFYVGELKSTKTYGFRLTDGKQVFLDDDGAYNPVISNGQNLYLTGYSIVYQLHPAEGRNVNGFVPKPGGKGKKKGKK